VEIKGTKMSLKTLESILEEEQKNFEKLYNDDSGNVYRFIGVLIAENDYYYSMMPCDGSRKLRLLSCVGGIESYGFEKVIND
jgi:hypothetical protein